MTVELIPVEGNKPNEGKYTFVLNNIQYGVVYHRIGKQITWHLANKEWSKVSEFFNSKQELLDYIDTLAELQKNANKIYNFSERAINGVNIKIRLTTEILQSGSVLGIIETSVRNDGNDQSANNWLIQAVFQYCDSNNISRPNRIALKWGSIAQ